MGRITVDEAYFNRVKVLQRKGLQNKEIRQFVEGSEETVRRCMISDTWKMHEELNRQYTHNRREREGKPCEQMQFEIKDNSVEGLLTLILCELRKMNERGAAV